MSTPISVLVKISVLIISITASTGQYIQHAYSAGDDIGVIPAGAFSIDTGNMITGDMRRGSNCARDSQCALELDLGYYCYGSNLRSIGTPLDNSKNIYSIVEITNSSGSQSKTIVIEFPPDLTMGTSIEKDCSAIFSGNNSVFISGDNFLEANCAVESQGKIVTTLRYIAIDSNQNGYYVHAFSDANNNIAKVMSDPNLSPALKNDLIDLINRNRDRTNNIICTKKNGSEVHCYLPALVETQSDANLKIYNSDDGKELTPGLDYEKVVAPNSILLKFYTGHTLNLDGLLPENSAKANTNPAAVNFKRFAQGCYIYAYDSKGIFNGYAKEEFIGVDKPQNLTLGPNEELISQTMYSMFGTSSGWYKVTPNYYFIGPALLLDPPNYYSYIEGTSVPKKQLNITEATFLTSPLKNLNGHNDQNQNELTLEQCAYITQN
ncbi:MAG: hypothetical protein HQK53_12105, partial [Oligoflexia bacterium]|nr:hypothetical protein [Oligoflexia bacterium]